MAVAKAISPRSTRSARRRRGRRPGDGFPHRRYQLTPGIPGNRRRSRPRGIDGFRTNAVGSPPGSVMLQATAWVFIKGVRALGVTPVSERGPATPSDRPDPGA
ncbi:MAG TPA: hypothetical protein ENH11_07925 [Candidatus Acetothermia bacterium]|nr:hypothetical protein [Candidatus Acetothermia bacterium]